MATREQARSWLRTWFAWHVKELGNMTGRAAAKGFGMAPESYQPFPGTTQTSYTLNAPTPAPAVAAAAATATRRLWPAIAAAALTGLGGAGVGALVAKYLGSSAEADAQIRVFWGEQEITPERPGQAVTE